MAAKPKKVVWREGWLASSPSLWCPKCGETAVRPAMFGLPKYHVWEAQERGEIDIHIGGCIVNGACTHYCKSCRTYLVRDGHGKLSVGKRSQLRG